MTACPTRRSFSSNISLTAILPGAKGGTSLAETIAWAVRAISFRCTRTRPWGETPVLSGRGDVVSAAQPSSRYLLAVKKALIAFALLSDGMSNGRAAPASDDPSPGGVGCGSPSAQADMSKHIPRSRQTRFTVASFFNLGVFVKSFFSSDLRQGLIYTSEQRP
jgi:hypothetical protein